VARPAESHAVHARSERESAAVRGDRRVEDHNGDSHR
jgi:hypothetical protein